MKPTTPQNPQPSREAKQLAAVVFDVLAGTRTPLQAAEALSLSLPRYYQLEARAVAGLLAACEAQPRGRQNDPHASLTAARKELERLKHELTRYQALVRLTQRTVGVTAPASTKSDKRKRKPVVRAMRRADQLRQEATAEPPPTDNAVAP